MALDADGKSKGYGYVHFETEEGAKAAVERMDEIEIMGTKVRWTSTRRRAARAAGARGWLPPGVMSKNTFFLAVAE